MKNINAIKTFMQENGVHFEEEFYVDFGEKQEKQYPLTLLN